ncbi:MAG: alkyl sulfatase C-terminal domain-containing protein [Acidimicrobiales bacterium]
MDMGDALGSGAITLDGDADTLVQLFGFLDEPSYTFNIVTP